MPLIEPPDYHRPWWLPGGHLQTVWPPLFRRVDGVRYQREALDLPDGDFLLLDWHRTASRRLAIISHGLEGHSRRAYVLGMVRLFAANGWDALAWNFRGAAGVPNRLPRFTTNNAAEDLAAVTAQAAARGHYDEITLVGFSMGGNLTLLYLGRHCREVPACVRSAVVLSVPLHAPTAGPRLSLPCNALYTRRFLRSLRLRMVDLNQRHPGLISLAGYERVRTLAQFDEQYTAPLHGFRGAREYWEAGNSRPYLGQITVPTLIINARNDPLLSPECFPVAEARASNRLFLEVPDAGGHCGFPGGTAGAYWSERRAVGFAEAAPAMTRAGAAGVAERDRGMPGAG